MHVTIEHNPRDINLGLSYTVGIYEDNEEEVEIFTIGLLFININFLW